MAYSDKGWDEKNRRDRERFGRDEADDARRFGQGSGRDWMGDDEEDVDYDANRRRNLASPREWDEPRQARMQKMQQQDRQGRPERGYDTPRGGSYSMGQRNPSDNPQQSSAGVGRPGGLYGGERYGSEGDSPYFTGQQGSWAVAPSDRTRRFSGRYGANYGDDYREHGYTAGGNSDQGGRGFIARAGDEIASWFGDEEAASRREQDHRGRGPTDYTRSDDRIREDANDRLTDDPRVDATHITVSVASGELTLNGTVTNRDAKRRAEDCVEDIPGVKHVQNNLRVQTTSAVAGSQSSAMGASAMGKSAASPGSTSGAAGASGANGNRTGTATPPS